jgi:SpoIID/LytB domain protein
LFVAALVAGLAPAVPARALVPVFAIDGKGLGHGVGMPQDGALAMARAKATVEQIMARFYPGTKWGKASGRVLVGVAEAGAATGRFTLSFPSGGEVRNGPDGSTAPYPIRVGRGGRVAVSFDGSTYHTEVLSPGVALGRHRPRRLHWVLAAATDDTTTTIPLLPTTAPAPAPSTTSTRPATTTTTANAAPRPPAAASGNPSTSSLWAVPASGGDVVAVERNREYRGRIEALNAAGGFRLINDVDVEDYLRGMGEVRNPSWPASGLEAQAVAARTYALRARGGLHPEGFNLYDDDRSQVYIGRPAEYAQMDKAVSKTKGRVLTYNGAFAATVYSASAGGITASAPEGFGPKAPDRPYLGVTRYDTVDPKPWHLEVAPADIAARLNYPGIPAVIAVSDRGPSGRALKVTLEGTAGSLTVDGTAFASALGLHSTLFDLGFTTAVAAPPPPPAPTALQQLPEGGAVVEGATASQQAAPATTPPTRPLPLATVFPTVDGRRQRGPLPPAVATLLLLAVTWLLVAQRSAGVGRITARGVSLAGAAARRLHPERPRSYGV